MQFHTARTHCNTCSHQQYAHIAAQMHTPFSQHCNTLQHAATHCNNTLQLRTATARNNDRLQHTATRFKTLQQDTATPVAINSTHIELLKGIPHSLNTRAKTPVSSPWLMCVAMCCSMMQIVALCCSVLQCVAVCCSVMQCVAVCCSVLQYIAEYCRV